MSRGARTPGPACRALLLLWAVLLSSCGSESDKSQPPVPESACRCIGRVSMVTRVSERSSCTPR